MCMFRKGGKKGRKKFVVSDEGARHLATFPARGGIGAASLTDIVYYNIIDPALRYGGSGGALGTWADGSENIAAITDLSSPTPPTPLSATWWIDDMRMMSELRHTYTARTQLTRESCRIEYYKAGSRALRRGHRPMLISRQTSIIGFPFKTTYRFLPLLRIFSARSRFRCVLFPRDTVYSVARLPGGTGRTTCGRETGEGIFFVRPPPPPPERLNSVTAVFSTGHLFREPSRRIVVYILCSPRSPRPLRLLLSDLTVFRGRPQEIPSHIRALEVGDLIYRLHDNFSFTRWPRLQYRIDILYGSYI